MRRPEDFFIKAVERSCGLQGVGEVYFHEQLKKGDPFFHSSLRYSLAKELTPLFLYYIAGMKAIYIYGSTIYDKAHLSSDLDLLILVKKKDPLLLFFLKEVDHLFSKTYRSYLGLKKKGQGNLLNVTIMDDQQMKGKEGLAVLIGSSFTPALRIWPKVHEKRLSS